MNVLHINTTRTWRGGEQQLASLIGQLAPRGIGNTIACRGGSAMERVAAERGWSHHPLPFRNALDPVSLAGLRRLITSGRFDVVHIHTGRGHDLAILAALSGCRTPMVLSRRVIFPISTNILSRWKYDFPQIRRILCASEAIAAMVRSVVAEPGRVCTVYDGVDPTRFGTGGTWLRTHYALPERTPLIGKVAALTGEKDHATFIESARIILRQIPEARFFIIGRGPEEARIAEMIHQSGLEGRMFMTGFLPNIAEVMPELDLVMMTSQSEGLGSSILDAFASRVPVVATDAGGIPEIVRDGETGMLAPVGDAETLALKGIEVLNDRELSERLVAGAHELLIDRHTDERMALDTLHEYRRAVDAGPRRPLFRPQAAV